MEFNATFLVSVISFLVFMKMMNMIFYAPITDIIEARENIVKENNEQANDANQKAENLLKDKENKLLEAAKESRQILIDKTNEANSDYQKRITEAKNHSNKKIDEMKNELIQSEQEAQTTLYLNIEDLAQAIVNKVLQGGLNG